MQIVQSQGKILQKSALHEIPRRWEIKKYYGIFHLGQLHVTCFDFTDTTRCPQLVPIGTRTTRHFNKGYVCMYVCNPWGHISQPSDADVS